LRLAQFLNSWIHHPLSSAQHRSPTQLFQIGSLSARGPRSPADNLADEIAEDQVGAQQERHADDMQQLLTQIDPEAEDNEHVVATYRQPCQMLRNTQQLMFAMIYKERVGEIKRIYLTNVLRSLC
jgi:hypothetical protein